MALKEIHVEGMTCGHCAETVTQAVRAIAGISQVVVDLEKKRVSVDFDESRTGLSEISSKIIEAGFEVVAD